MSRTVTALYDTRAEAEAARQRLGTALDLGSARIIDQASGLDALHMSGEDRHVYAEGIRRGAFVLSAEVRGHEEADKIIRILEEGPSLDLDSRQEMWRRDGWSSQAPLAPSGMAPAHPVGRREPDRGGPRVRSYLRDVPAHEQVGRRPEVERPPVQPVPPVQHARPEVAGPAPTFPAPDYQRPAPVAAAPVAAPMRSGPSQARVIRSAIAGAVAGGVIGGAIPFMLGGRESNVRRDEQQRELGPDRRPTGTIPAFGAGRDTDRR